MRAVLLLLAGALFALPEPPPSLDGLRWLEGVWRAKSGKSEIEEYWLEPKGARMLGLGQTSTGGRMVAFEYLRIERRDAGIFYVAQPSGRPPVDFKMTRLEGHEVVFENPAHDFPKVVSYRRDGDALVARISGDQKGKAAAKEFAFRRAR
jgi:hypothetical protein